ncbi:MAG: hypothetical protein ABSC72_10555 [Methylovirgula sp.]|jgi:hypothetical protein
MNWNGNDERHRALLESVKSLVSEVYRSEAVSPGAKEVTYKQALRVFEAFETLDKRTAVEFHRVNKKEYELFLSAKSIVKAKKFSPSVIEGNLGHEQSHVTLSPNEPPRLAELMVCSCAKKRYRDGMLDSLEEDFRRDLANGMTPARARCRYWGAALSSIAPQLRAALRRIGLIGVITKAFWH